MQCGRRSCICRSMQTPTEQGAFHCLISTKIMSESSTEDSPRHKALLQEHMLACSSTDADNLIQCGKYSYTVDLCKLLMTPHSDPYLYFGASWMIRSRHKHNLLYFWTWAIRILSKNDFAFVSCWRQCDKCVTRLGHDDAFHSCHSCCCLVWNWMQNFLSGKEKDKEKKWTLHM